MSTSNINNLLDKLQSIVSKNKSVIRYLGYALSLGFVVLIALSLYEDRNDLEGILINKNLYFSSALAVFIVVVGNIINSLANWILLSDSCKTIKYKHLLVINGFSQLAKYLPGNVFHLVGRFFLLKKYTDSKTSLYFSLYEICLQVIVAATIGIFYFYLIQIFPEIPLTFYILFYGVSVIASLIILIRLKLLPTNFLSLILAYMINLFSFCLYGVALFAILTFVLGQQNVNFAILSVVFAISFLAGYVMPGASGGIGVREYIFMVLAQPFVDSSLALSAVVIFRFCSISGDLVFGLYSMAIKKIYKIEFLSP